MVENQKIYEVKITDISSDGNCVGKIDGVAIFVPQTVDGDVVRVKITKLKSRFAFGEAVDFIEKSPIRKEIDCPYFNECGGCHLRHIPYELELEKKQKFVNEALRRIGGIKDFSSDEIEYGKELRYRNKAVYQSDGQDSGFYSPKSHTLIAVGDCLLCDERDTKIRRAVTENTDKCESIFIRRSRLTGEAMVVISAKSEPSKNLAAAVLSADESVSGIIFNENLILGKREIEDSLLGVKFKISDKSFYQINPEMTEKLYKKALEYAALTGKENVLDIYCGIGTISLCASKSARRVTGVEIVEKAIEDAKENAKINGIENAVFFAGAAEKIVPQLIKNGEKPDVVILDPPRKGSDEKTLNAILNASPERIVYVSCNPATLARDVKYLTQNGYTLNKATAFDLFPRTNHVESVCLLTKIKRQKLC